MTHFIPGTELPICTQKVLQRLFKKLTDRQIASLYRVANQKYICDLRLHNREPTRTTPKGQEARYAMGLDHRPPPEWLRPAADALSRREIAEPRVGLRVYTRSGKCIAYVPYEPSERN